MCVVNGPAVGPGGALIKEDLKCGCGFRCHEFDHTLYGIMPLRQPPSSSRYLTHPFGL